MTKPAVPIASDVIGPAIDAMRETRTIDEAHISFGRWGHIIAGWRGQFELARKRLAEEFAARRLKTASGAPLTELASSDYETEREGARAAVGEATLVREVTHFTGGGIIATPNATTLGEANALIEAIRAACIAHFASVYNPSTGVGAHVFADTVTPVPLFLPSAWSSFVEGANDVRFAVSSHVTSDGWHKDAATHADIPEAFFALITDGSGNPLSDIPTHETEGSRLSVFRCINAAKAAFNAHVADYAPAGVIRRGHRFEVRANPAARPPISGAQYTVAIDTFVQTGEQTTAPRVTCSTQGTVGNQPNWAVEPDKTVQSLDTLYDAAQPRHFAPTELVASGGHGGQSDPSLRRAASANWAGRHGPTTGAIVAGALTEQGATRAVVREDAATGTVLVYPVDESWAQSNEWKANIADALADENDGWLGFGCRLSTERVQNQSIRVELTVRLRDAHHLLDTSKVTAKIQQALRAYFDDRPDWYVWRLASLRGAVTKADRRILACPSAAVIDINTNLPLSEPAIPAAASGVVLTHYALNDQDVLISYTAPV